MVENRRYRRVPQPCVGAQVEPALGAFNHMVDLRDFLSMKMEATFETFILEFLAIYFRLDRSLLLFGDVELLISPGNAMRGS